MRGLEGVPGLPGAPQDEAGLIFVRIWASRLLEKLWETAGFTFQKSFLRILISGLRLNS